MLTRVLPRPDPGQSLTLIARQRTLHLSPSLGSIVDDIALIRSANGISNDHVLAHYEWNTGSLLMGFPSVGSWVTYGLGSVCRDLPGFVVLNSGLTAVVLGLLNGQSPVEIWKKHFRADARAVDDEIEFWIDLLEFLEANISVD